MTNNEMYEKFKEAGAPVEEGMTQVEMRAVMAEYKKDDTPEFTIMVKDGLKYKVQSQDVAACMASGMKRKE